MFDLNIYDCSLCRISISLVSDDVWLVVEVGYHDDLMSGVRSLCLSPSGQLTFPCFLQPAPQQIGRLHKHPMHLK